MIDSSNYTLQKFVFNIYDIDCDGILSSADIVEVQANIAPSSVIGEEVEMIANHFVNTRIKSELLRDLDIITF